MEPVTLIQVRIIYAIVWKVCVILIGFVLKCVYVWLVACTSYINVIELSVVYVSVCWDTCLRLYFVFSDPEKQDGALCSELTSSSTHKQTNACVCGLCACRHTCLHKEACVVNFRHQPRVSSHHCHVKTKLMPKCMWGWIPLQCYKRS